MKYVVITGNIACGVEEVFGPFDSHESALKYAETISGIEWEIYPLDKPGLGD